MKTIIFSLSAMPHDNRRVSFLPRSLGSKRMFGRRSLINLVECNSKTKKVEILFMGYIGIRAVQKEICKG